MGERTATLSRETKETCITLSINLDGKGESSIDTGIGFFSHMMELFAKHGLFDVEIRAEGDTEVDYHHTVEDIGLVLGQAVFEALGDKKGIRRYGFASVPMDEALSQTTIDLGGRPHLSFQCGIENEKVGEFDTELCREFFQAVAAEGKMNIHIDTAGGTNTHHIIESVFKSFARALRQAVSCDARETGIPSTKGTL
jgi:imidazoleglycerol-phosphate dehydratase